MISQEPALTVTDLHMCFTQHKLFKPKQKTHVLKGISFILHKGESLAVIGLNGAGKSTLLRVMAGIFEPDAGRVINHGVSTSLLGFSRGTFPECSGRDNIIMLLMLQHCFSRKQATAMVDKVTAYAELEDVIDAPLYTYSSGMQARLRFSIAMQASADVLLVDEILSVGDLPFKKKSLASMRQKLQSGETVVLVSHALQDIKEFCTRAVWIEHGELIADGPAEDIVGEYEKFYANSRKTRKQAETKPLLNVASSCSAQ